MNIRYLHIATLIAFIFSIEAQAQSLKEYYKALHGDIEKCKTYHGQLDNDFPLEMLICGDKGVYKMYSSSDIYNISITSDGDQIEITEEDNQGRISGYITLTNTVSDSKTGVVYNGEWQHIESPTKYPFSIFEIGQKTSPTPKYLTKLSGIIRSRVVEIIIDHSKESVSISEQNGLRSFSNSEYECLNNNCSRIKIKPKGFIGVNSVEIYKKKNGEYGMAVISVDQHREISELEFNAGAKSSTKAYSDYSTMLLAEYATFDDKDLNNYLYQLQSNWIKSTSANLRAIIKKDETEIVSDRLKRQAFSWIEIEHWTEDFISGVQYNQYSWKADVEAKAFAYNIDKSRVISLNNVWKEDWSPNSLETKIDNNYSTWVAGREAISKIYFDRITGINRESFPYASMRHHIDKGSWLHKLLDQDIIRD